EALVGELVDGFGGVPRVERDLDEDGAEELGLGVDVGADLGVVDDVALGEAEPALLAPTDERDAGAALELDGALLGYPVHDVRVVAAGGGDADELLELAAGGFLLELLEDLVDELGLGLDGRAVLGRDGREERE